MRNGRIKEEGAANYHVMSRPMAVGKWGDLCTVRRLRMAVITPPAIC